MLGKNPATWFVVLSGLPFFLFLVLWIRNSQYMMKFLPVSGDHHPWYLGPGLLVLAGTFSILILPLGFVFQKLGTIQPSGLLIYGLRVFLIILAVILFLLSTFLIALGPAGMTMADEPLTPDH